MLYGEFVEQKFGYSRRKSNNDVNNEPFVRISCEDLLDRIIHVVTACGNGGTTGFVYVAWRLAKKKATLTNPPLCRNIALQRKHTEQATLRDERERELLVKLFAQNMRHPDAHGTNRTKVERLTHRRSMLHRVTLPNERRSSVARRPPQDYHAAQVSTPRRILPLRVASLGMLDSALPRLPLLAFIGHG